MTLGAIAGRGGLMRRRGPPSTQYRLLLARHRSSH
jgi:hypothetical protein